MAFGTHLLKECENLHAEAKLNAILLLDLPNFSKDWLNFILDFQILNLKLLLGKIMLLP